MFALQAVGTFRIDNPSDAYIYDILAVSEGVVLSSSDDAVRLLDPLNLNGPPLQVLRRVHAGVTCLDLLDGERSLIATAGRDGRAMMIDLHNKLQIAEIKLDQNTPILSLASCAPAYALATGTELVGSQASIHLWDTRNLATPIGQYVDSHSDDVTVLKYHPMHGSILLSGSTDGLVNLFNTAVVEEEDSLYQTINHGSSLHRAGFLNEFDIFALSHDEKFSIHKMVSDIEESIEEPPPFLFGDMRGLISCDYVVDVLGRSGGGWVVGAGSHSGDRFDLIQLQNATPWKLLPESKVSLFDAHGEEVVRSFCFIDKYKMVLTGGEDGQLKAWKGEE